MKYLEKHFSIKFIEKWKKKVFSSKFIITKIVPIENRLQNIDYYYTFLTQQIRKATTGRYTKAPETWVCEMWIPLPTALCTKREIGWCRENRRKL